MSRISKAKIYKTQNSTDVQLDTHNLDTISKPKSLCFNPKKSLDFGRSSISMTQSSIKSSQRPARVTIAKNVSKLGPNFSKKKFFIPSFLKGDQDDTPTFSEFDISYEESEAMGDDEIEFEEESEEVSVSRKPTFTDYCNYYCKREF